MRVLDLARARLVAQGLVTRPYREAAEAVTAFGAMQGQDLPGVIASAALRVRDGSAAAVIEAMNSADLVRGYPMRGTVFLMPAVDAVWMTELCAGPSLRAAAARRHHRDLDGDDIDRAREVAVEVLAAGPLSRSALFEAWDAAGLATREGRGYHCLFTLIAETTVCYGPFNGTDQDVALVSTWLPGAERIADRFGGDRIAAVAELLRRYLTTHGPATIRDFAWWTKLALGEIRRALPIVARELESDGAAEPLWWRQGLLDEVADLKRRSAMPLLLPGFDEFVLGYQDRLFAMTPDHHQLLVPGNNGVFKKAAVVGARVGATWSRGGRPGRRILTLEEFVPLSATARAALDAKFAAYPFVGE